MLHQRTPLWCPQYAEVRPHMMYPSASAQLVAPCILTLQAKHIQQRYLLLQMCA